MQNIPQQFPTTLCQKKKTFLGFFIEFLKCAWNLEHFQKNDEYPSLIISEITNAERRGYLNVWKVLLKNTIRKWTCSRVKNTAEISTAPLLPSFLVNSG